MHASTGKTTLSAFMDKPFEITETTVTSKSTKTHVTTDRSIEVSVVIDIQIAIKAYLVFILSLLRSEYFPFTIFQYFCN